MSAEEKEERKVLLDSEVKGIGDKIYIRPGRAVLLALTSYGTHHVG